MQGQESLKFNPNDFDKEPDSPNQEQNAQLADALANYFERKNSGEQINTVAYVQTYPQIQTELSRAINVLQIPDKAAKSQPNTKAAWRRFKTEVFTGQTVNVTAPESLGTYVAQAIQQNDRELKSTGLPQITLEALSHDATPLTEFQNYKFDDYAQLAKRYGVKNELFPHVLKWFKGLSKSLSLNPGGGNSFVFAREEDFKRELSESDLVDALEESSDKEEE